MKKRENREINEKSTYTQHKTLSDFALKWDYFTFTTKYFTL